jgi:hypothetical protein
MARPSSYGRATGLLWLIGPPLRFFLCAKERGAPEGKSLGFIDPGLRDGWRASKDLYRHAPRVCCV